MQHDSSTPSVFYDVALISQCLYANYLAPSLLGYDFVCYISNNPNKKKDLKVRDLRRWFQIQ